MSPGGRSMSSRGRPPNTPNPYSGTGILGYPYAFTNICQTLFPSWRCLTSERSSLPNFWKMVLLAARDLILPMSSCATVDNASSNPASSKAGSILVFQKDQLAPYNSGTDARSSLQTIVFPGYNPLMVCLESSCTSPDVSPSGSIFPRSRL